MDVATEGEGTYVQVGEPICVVAHFQPDQPRIPRLAFLWRGRRYEIRRVHYYHPQWHGEALVHYIEVTASGKYFKLSFNAKRLQWRLETMYEP